MSVATVEPPQHQFAAGRTRPGEHAVRHAVQLIHTRPHLTVVARPQVGWCRGCQAGRLVDRNPVTPAPAWFASGLAEAILWNI